MEQQQFGLAGAPTQPVAAQTFDPFINFGFAGPPTSQKLATGQYRVTFPKVNQDNSWGHVESSTGMNDVIVQRTCSNDSSATCKRAVCIPSSWTFNSSPNSNSTVDVSCYQGNTLVDVDFRVFMGNESHSSQAPDWLAAIHYGWANSPSFSSNSCKGTTEFRHRNQHESPISEWPTLPLTACKTGTGAAVLPAATASASCLPDPAVTVRCYDSNGSAANAVWNLSVLY